jgi:hypothetical protein
MNAWPQNCGTGHCSCVECVAPLSPHHAKLLRQALEALEVVTKHFTRTPSTLKDTEARGQAHKAITAIKEALK